MIFLELEDRRKKMSKTVFRSGCGSAVPDRRETGRFLTREF